MLAGGHSELKAPDAKIVEFFTGLKGEIEANTGKTYETFEIIGYT